MNFEVALKTIMDDNTIVVQRKTVKNDTVIRNYKNRLYQHSAHTGVRYSYTPSNKDIFADDWEIADIQKINKKYQEKNINKLNKLEVLKDKVIELIDCGEVSEAGETILNRILKT